METASSGRVADGTASPAGGDRPTTLRTDARWVITLVLATALVYFMYAVLSIYVFDRYSGRSGPVFVVNALQAAALLQLTLYVVGGVLWVRWLRGLSLRLRSAGREGMQFTPGWAIGWYFVPIANFTMPMRVMQELWQASDPDRGATNWKTSAPTPLVWAWWLPFIVGNLAAGGGIGGSLAGGRGGLFIGNAVGMTLVGVAGVVAVILIRRLEFRMAGVEAAAGADAQAPRTGHAILGAVVGALVAAGWWVIIGLLLSNLGPAPRYVSAIIVGGLVGYWTLLGAGGRSRTVAIVAGVGGLLAVINADRLIYGLLALFTFIPFLIMRPDKGLPYLWHMLPFALLAAAAATAVALLKLPIDLWIDGGAPMRPRIPRAHAPVAEGAPVVPATAAPRHEVTHPPAPARGPFDFGGFFAKNRALLLGALAVVVVVVVGVTAFALGRAGSRNQGAAPAASEPEASQPAESDGAEPLPAGTAPRDVVLAMYEAAARGDEDVVRSTFAFGFNFDPGVLEAWGKPRHEVQLVADGADPAETFVQVLETGGGFSDRDVVTWILREEAGRWRIGGWMLGPLEDFPEITGGTGDPITGLDGAGSDATNLVAEFLQARMGGDVVTMRDLATARLESESPELFITEGPSLIGWRLASVTTEGASRVIWIEESWDYSPNMPEVRLYVVVEQGGGLLVDEYR